MKRKKKVNVISYLLQVQLSVFRTSLILRYHRSQNKKFKEECIKIIIAKMQESKKRLYEHRKDLLQSHTIKALVVQRNKAVNNFDLTTTKNYLRRKCIKNTQNPDDKPKSRLLYNIINLCKSDSATIPYGSRVEGVTGFCSYWARLKSSRRWRLKKSHAVFFVHSNRKIRN